MRAALSALLAEAKLPVSVSEWNRLVVLRSSGALINHARKIDRNLSDRGFHFVVLTPAGDISHYCKCRPSLPDGTRHRETLVLDAFGQDADARKFIPTATNVRNDEFELQAAQYVHGELLNRSIKGMDAAKRAAMIDEVRIAAAALAQAALARPDVFHGPFAASSVLDRAAAALAVLPRIGVPAEAADTVQRALDDAGALPRVPQHGDLWPENILVTRAGWCVLDLDNYGDVDVPLYDVLHLIRTTEDAAYDLQKPWIEMALANDSYGAQVRRAIAAESRRWNLNATAVGGATVFYLMHIAVHIFSRGAPEFVYGRFRDEIAAAADALMRAGSVAKLGEALLRP